MQNIISFPKISTNLQSQKEQQPNKSTLKVERTQIQSDTT